VTAKARNERALAMKSQAFLLGIPIFESKALARALYDQTDTGDEIGESRFRDVADLYLKLQTSGRNRP
jgi:flagellar biosynthetic protein FlhB